MTNDQKQEINWHSKSVEEVLTLFNSNRRGLSKEEVRKRLMEYGPNELKSEERVTPVTIFINQFKSILIIILIIAAAISGLILNEYIDMYMILAIVIANAILGFVQEYRAERAVEALKKMVTPSTFVKREGRVQSIPSRELVPGDVIILEEGARVPADGRLLITADLKIDEAALTGESVAVEKKNETCGEEAQLTDRTNMVYMGTSVAYGRGEAIVVATGMSTAFGNIAQLVQTIEMGPPPLRKRVEKLGRQLGLIAVSLCILIFGLMFAVHQTDAVTIFLTSVSMGVSAIPEGLPAVITITLALGIGRMARQKAIVKKLASVETLGSATIICSDKTGTLTKGEMTVRKLFYNGKVIEVTGSGYEPNGTFENSMGDRVHYTKSDDELLLLMRIGALCNNARIDEADWEIIGDPTEGALIIAALKAGLQIKELNKNYPRLGEIPFCSERKCMTSINSTPTGDLRVYLKGAFEVIIERCNKILWKGIETPLTDDIRDEVLKINNDMAMNAYRVLAMAYRRLSDDWKDLDEEEIESNMVFVGLAGLIDPPRPEAKVANRLCEEAGIRTIMITGDHKLTATAIAKELNMLKNGLVLTGSEIDKLDDTQFADIVEQASVYARVLPEHKLRIVKELKKKGHIVAMTGDGVNDAPAMKTADIGVAMGITGTDVTKEASDMILQDDNFATLVAAVKEGRQILDNISKYIRLMITSNFDEFVEIAIVSIAGIPLLYLPIHILWINLVTDGLPAISLSVDPADPDIMRRPPRDTDEGFLSRIKYFILYVAVVDCLSDLIPYLWVFLTTGDVVKARTIAVTSTCLFEFLLIWNCRSETHSVFDLPLKDIIANKMLFVTVIVSTVFLLSIVYIPFLQSIFHTTYLTGFELAICVVGALSALTVFPGKLIRKPKPHSKAFIKK